MRRGERVFGICSWITFQGGRSLNHILYLDYWFCICCYYFLCTECCCSSDHDDDDDDDDECTRHHLLAVVFLCVDARKLAFRLYSLRFLSSRYSCTSMLCRHCKWPPIIIILWMTQEAIWSQLCNCTLFTITIFSFVRIFIIIFPFGWCINLESNFSFHNANWSGETPSNQTRNAWWKR